RIVTYGMSPQADLRADNIRLDATGAAFDVIVTDRQHDRRTTLSDFRLPMVGAHNVQNALAAIAVALEMGIVEDVIRRALAGFRGVKRRFTKIGESNGVTVIDDYGHHPVEIAAVLRAARNASAKRVVAVVQPHRYTRLRDLFEEFCTCFNEADVVIVADVYTAGEQPIEGVDRDALVAGIQSHGHHHVEALNAPEDLAGVVSRLISPGDLVICLGAGDIRRWAHALPAALDALNPPQSASDKQAGR
ncbi:MAG: Mur ligase family protein, partial [Proteobacteria bacterium]|nr:Mur ligase family protein [Pseudomonadota bacterium]